MRLSQKLPTCGIFFFYIQYTFKWGLSKMAQWLQALAALGVDLGSISSINMAAHNNTQV